MKSKYFLFLMITSILYSCKALKNKYPLLIKRKMIMPMFDLQKLQKSKTSGYVYFLSNEGNNIYLINNSDDYQEAIQLGNNPFGITCKYYKNSLNLKSESITFYHNLVGILKEYDQKHHIVNQINNDEGWSFSVGDLINKMKKDFNIDLLREVPQLSVTRYADKSKNVFEYYIHYPIDHIAYRSFIVNGKTGKVISDYKGNNIE